MNKLTRENAKELYRRNKGHIDNLVNIAMIELPNIIRDEDKDRTLDIFEINDITQYLLIKLIKNYR